MTIDVHSANKLRLRPLRQVLYDFEPNRASQILDDVFTPEAEIHLAFPFEDLPGAGALFENAFLPLSKSLPDLERRDTIVIAGDTPLGANWVGCGGYYTGNFVNSWLDIPPTGRQVAMRFHEFFRFEDGKIVEMQALWDIPEVMMQANAWPMTPSLGREWHVPGPASQDGLVTGPRDTKTSAATRQHVIDMLTALKRHPSEGGPELMEMERFWHPKMNWYGPAGIGTARGMQGFRDWHQIPFVKAMPDRGQYVDQITYQFFGDGNYAGVTGWPNMIQTLTHDGWLGIAATGQKITMRSLDFWRCENGLIRENWVLVDLLDVYQQIGVNVFDRLREFNKARQVR